VNVIVLLNADDADDVEIIQCEFGNRTFETVEAADMWVQKHAECGWVTRIIDLDD
jgi:hypothetical protein